MHNIGCDTTKKHVFRYHEKQVWIPPSKKDRLRDHSPAIEDDDEADESYNPLNDEDDEANAQTTILRDAFPTEMQTTFEQLRITQEFHGVQFVEIVESTRHHADELAQSIDFQEVMLAQLCNRIMPDQGSSGGGGTNFSPQ
ncbi:hypothetical protein M9H77_30396 [Catharanthus roseus]|uniref:Uncharacterized protein n=1 Tax=Catharanthus roseus TaxID=4058 RepID=A0ACB9ZXZ5_CATRO|nr:hypothetical protein M9H77_30396 [Catharanthus roseus]